MRLGKRFQILAALVVCGLTAPAGLMAAEDTIKVGEVGSMTGTAATFGTSTHKGIELAIKELNSQGGIKGKKIEVISFDDQGKPEEAAQGITRLITKDKVVAVLGEVASGRSLAMAPIAQRSKIPMITPSSTNPAVTKVGDYIFRVCFIDPFQGTVMANFASKTLKAKNVAVLTDLKNDYSVGLTEFFAKQFKANGGKIVAEQKYAEGDIDFKSQLTAIKAKNPEAIFVPGYYTEVGLIARQARELGIKAPLLGGDGWDSPKLTEIGGKAIDGSYLSNHYSTEDKSPAVQNFITKYKAAYNEVPDSLAALGYDAMLILGDSMKRAKTLGGEDLKNAIKEIKDFPGVAGKVTIDGERNAVKSAVVLKVDGGQFKYQETIQPIL